MFYTVKIEKGVPVPLSLSGILRKLEVGDSFELPSNEYSSPLIHSTAKHVNIKVLCRTDRKKKIRKIWRIE